MAEFSKTSKTNLKQAHIDLQTLFNEVIQIVDCSVICGHRGEKAQNEAFDKGFSKVRFPNGKHNKKPAMAVDVMKYPINWENKQEAIEFMEFVMKIADRLLKEGKIKHRIEAGGRWVTFPDLPHYQIHE